MKAIKSLILSISMLVAVSATAQQLKPFQPEKWAEIEAYTKANWITFSDTTDVLPYPFSFALNPGTLYYWDIYFLNEGLMLQGEWELAKHNLDNFIFEIEQLGFVPNAHGWGEDRSQTAYFSMMVRSLYEKNPLADKAWLGRAYKAAMAEYEFWTNSNGNTIEDHSTCVQGLNRLGEHATREDLIIFYDRVLQHRFGLEKGASEDVKVEYASHRLAEAESMDFTPRFEGRGKDYIPVDLNANLYQYEMNFAFFEKELGIKSGINWEKKAKQRAKLIDKYLWSEERGLYLDYDCVNQRHSPVASIITVMPMYWGMASSDKAERLLENLPLFASRGGYVVCEPSEQTILYQWGDASVWAPMQFVVMGAQERYGDVAGAKHTALTFLNTITRNFVSPVPATYRAFKYGDGTRHPGFLYEKYDREGNINDAEYPCSEMMGWTAATFLRALEVYNQ